VIGLKKKIQQRNEVFMKLSKDQKKLGALVFLILLLVTGTFFSIQKAIAPSPGYVAGVSPIPPSQSVKAQKQYAGMLPDELTPPGEVTPVNTPIPTPTTKVAPTEDE
jgi:hypothetical protein